MLAQPASRREDSWSGRPRDASELRVVRQLERRMAPVIRRAHLPRYPGGPAALAVLGLLGLIFVAGLAQDFPAARPTIVAMYGMLSALVLLPLGLLVTGAWDLARGPLHFFSPRWYERLTRH